MYLGFTFWKEHSSLVKFTNQSLIRWFLLVFKFLPKNSDFTCAFKILNIKHVNIKGKIKIKHDYSTFNYKS